MIDAQKSAWFERAFDLYNRQLMARRFTGLRVRGLEHLLEQRGRSLPLVLYCNHSSWWDALTIFQTGRAARLEQYAMMEERQLRQYMFLRKLGAFSIIREDARAALVSIEYAVSLLRQTNRTLWIFPQGVTEPNDVRPLKLYNGLARIIARTGAYVAPVAMRFEFLNEYRPDAFVRIEKPELYEITPALRPKALTALLAERLTQTLDALRCDILTDNLADYVELVAHERRKKLARQREE